MRVIAVIAALLAALIALLSGLAFWGAACVIIVMPMLEHSPIKFLSNPDVRGLAFVTSTFTAGLILLAGAYELVGQVMDMVSKTPAPPERPAQPALRVLEGGKTTPPSA